ncbi:hypothetical protein NEOC65_001444 [Neochlamydia sp. AcF65]|nr:hypothetical protein [Neochlamydia sp. AcF65]
MCTSYGNGKKHDFRLFKESQVKINPQIRVLTDSGYQGLKKLHAQTQMPKKKSKKKPLTKEEKKQTKVYREKELPMKTSLASLSDLKL